MRKEMIEHIHCVDPGELIEGYERFNKKVNNQNGWTGPSMYFHKKTKLFEPTFKSK